MNELPAIRPPWLAWPETNQLIKAFAVAGAEIRFVGGCVRDAYLGKPVQDVDAATPLPPEQVMTLLEKAGIKTIPTGIEHGTITARVQGKVFEITTLRKDTACDGRHATVAYTDDWKEDAARRDFTINALYLSPEGKTFDYFDGLQDLQEGRVRFIGQAAERIAEDTLRILRFFRFHARYGRGAPPDTDALQACMKLAHHLGKLSGERVRDEILKLLAMDASRTLQLMQDENILPHALGFAVPDCDIFRRITEIEALTGGAMAPYGKLMGFALKAETGPAQALDKIIARLKLSNDEVHALRMLHAHQGDIHYGLTVAQQKKLIRKLGSELFAWLVVLRWAQEEKAIAEHPYQAMIALAKSWQMPVFPVRGIDLMALGMKPGKAMGQALAELEAYWEEQDYRPGKSALVKRLKKTG